LKNEYATKIEFVKIDVTNPDNREFTAKHRIEAVPTLLFIGKDGKRKKMIVGLSPKETIEKELKNLLK